MNAMKRQSKLDVAKYATYGVFAALGVGQILGAQTGLEATLALLDMGVFGSDIIINETLATKLNQTPDSRAFLDKYNKLTLLYGVTRFYAQFTNLIDELKSLSNRLKDPEVDELMLKLENQALVAWLSNYPNLLKKVSTLDEATQELFRSSFAKASDQALTVLDGHTAWIDTWLNYTQEDRQLVGQNADLWTKQLEAYPLLQQSKYTDVATLFGNTLETPYAYKGYNYVEAPNFPKDYDNAIAIANRTDDIDIIATYLQKVANLNLEYAKKIVGEVKQHYWINEHLVELEPQKWVVGRFFKDSGDITIWNGAIKGDVGVDFQRLLIHEYIESKLMASGLPYRGLSGSPTTSFSYGAHDLSPLAHDSSMTWSNLQRINPNQVVSINNLDDLVNFIKKAEGL